MKAAANELFNQLSGSSTGKESHSGQMGWSASSPSKWLLLLLSWGGALDNHAGFCSPKHKREYFSFLETIT